jgi:hypothetical protein
MKKYLRIVLTVLFVVALCAPSFAAKKSPKKFERIVAHVTSLDVAAKTIGITEEKSGAVRTIKISAKAASQLKVGDRVRIKLKPGTDESAGVLVLKPQPPESQPVEPQPQTPTPAPEKSPNP